LLPQIQDAIREGDTQSVDALLSAMEMLDPKLAYSTGNAVYSEGGIDKPEVVDNLRMKQSRGVLTFEDVNSARADGGLGQNTYDEFLGVVSSQQEQDHKDAMTIVRNEINPVPSIMPGKAERERNNKIGDIETKLIKARRKARKDEELFDPIVFVEAELKALGDVQYTPQQISAAKETVKKLRGLLGLPDDANFVKIRTVLSQKATVGSRLLVDSADYNDALVILESIE